MMGGVQAIANGADPYIGSAAVQYGPGSELIHYLYLHVFGFDLVHFRQSTVLLYWLAATIFFVVLFIRLPLRLALITCLVSILLFPTLQMISFQPNGADRRRGRPARALGRRLLGLAERDALRRRLRARDAVPGRRRTDRRSAVAACAGGRAGRPLGPHLLRLPGEPGRRHASRSAPWRSCSPSARRSGADDPAGAARPSARWLRRGRAASSSATTRPTGTWAASSSSTTCSRPRWRPATATPSSTAASAGRGATSTSCCPSSSAPSACSRCSGCTRSESREEWSRERILLVSALVAACVSHGGSLLRATPPTWSTRCSPCRSPWCSRSPTCPGCSGSSLGRGVVATGAAAGGGPARAAAVHPDRERRRPAPLAAGAVLLPRSRDRLAARRPRLGRGHAARAGPPPARAVVLHLLPLSGLGAGVREHPQPAPPSVGDRRVYVANFIDPMMPGAAYFLADLKPGTDLLRPADDGHEPAAARRLPRLLQAPHLRACRRWWRSTRTCPR